MHVVCVVCVYVCDVEVVCESTCVLTFGNLMFWLQKLYAFIIRDGKLTKASREFVRPAAALDY